MLFYLLLLGAVRQCKCRCSCNAERILRKQQEEEAACKCVCLSLLAIIAVLCFSIQHEKAESFRRIERAAVVREEICLRNEPPRGRERYEVDEPSACDVWNSAHEAHEVQRCGISISCYCPDSPKVSIYRSQDMGHIITWKTRYEEEDALWHCYVVQALRGAGGGCNRTTLVPHERMMSCLRCSPLPHLLQLHRNAAGDWFITESIFW